MIINEKVDKPLEKRSPLLSDRKFTCTVAELVGSSFSVSTLKRFRESGKQRSSQREWVSESFNFGIQSLDCLSIFLSSSGQGVLGKFVNRTQRENSVTEAIRFTESRLVAQTNLLNNKLRSLSFLGGLHRMDSNGVLKIKFLWI